MNLENVHYDAFISYRHSEHDLFVATTLQRKLEAFRLPRPLAANTKGKTRIERVFRDQDELPLASNLSDPIEEALKNADFLIVICSPRLPESMWCKKEIETFAKLHGRDHILAVLCEGEPSEAFPPFLQSETVETVNERGEKVLVTRAVEPLAAEARANTRRETKKLLDDAVLRIAAPIFGLNYDDLKQRHREQRIKKLAAVWGSVGAAVLLFAVVCMVMLLQINSKNKTIELRNAEISERNTEIEAQNAEIIKQNEEITLKNQEILKQNEEISNKNDEISSKNEEITKQRDEIEAQYLEASKSYAVSMVSAAERLIGNGRRLDAIYALRNAMSDTLEGDALPYTAETHSALARLVEAYDDSTLYTPGRIIETPITISDFAVSPSGETVAIYAENFGIQVFRTATGELIYENTELNVNDSLFYKVYLTNDNSLIVACNEPYRIDLDTGAVTDYVKSYESLGTKFTIREFYNCPEQERYIITASHKLMVFNSADNTLITDIDAGPAFTDEASRSIYNAKVTLDGKYLYAVFQHTDSDFGELVLFDLTDGSPVHTVSIAEAGLFHIADDGKRIFVCYPYSENGLSYRYEDVKIDAFSIKTGQLLWSKTYAENGIEYISDLTYCSEGNYLLADSSISCEAIDPKDGSISSHIELESGQISRAIIKNGSVILYFCRNNSVLVYAPILGSSFEYTDSFYKFAPSGQISSITYAGSKLFLLPENENYLVLYEKANRETFPEGGKVLYTDNLSGNGRYAVRPTNEGYSVFSTEDGTELYSIGVRGYYAHFTADSSRCINVEDEVITIYDNKTGEAVHSIFLPDLVSLDYDNYLTPGGSYIIATEHSVDYSVTGRDIYSAETGEFVTVLPANKSTMLAVADTGEIYATTYSGAENDNTSSVKLCRLNSTEPYAEAEIDIKFLSNLFFSNDAEYLFAEYVNGTLEIYDTKTLRPVNTHYGVSNMPVAASYIEKYNIYCIARNEGVQLFNTDMEVISELANARSYDADRDVFIVVNSSSNSIKYVPYMSYEDILSRADALLDGYEMPARIKAEYGIK